MKSLKYIFSAWMLIFAIAFTSCELPDNLDPKEATEVPVSTIFTNSLVTFANTVTLQVLM